jgi:hypothetical protein
MSDQLTPIPTDAGLDDDGPLVDLDIEREAMTDPSAIPPDQGDLGHPGTDS